MILLRSMPEFSTMCIGAIDFLGDTMNCKGSVLSSIDCNDSSWCDSRDEEVIESKSASHIAHEEQDLSSRYGDLLDTQSLSSSVHHLLHDSSQRQSQHTTATLPSPSDDDIFRSRNTSQESSNQCLTLNKLNRCTAWIQDDYSFDESERPVEDSKKESDVRIVHWEDRVQDSDSLNAKSGYDIFRSNNVTFGSDSQYFGLCKLHRCAAWSLDGSSSSVVENNISSVRRESLSFGSNEAKIVHWDELVQDVIY